MSTKYFIFNLKNHIASKTVLRKKRTAGALIGCGRGVRSSRAAEFKGRSDKCFNGKTLFDTFN
jgi:hypothetical protein